MNSKSKIQNGTFCVLPWIEKFHQLNGKKYFCCWARMDKPIDPLSDDELKELRSNILNGVKVDHCTHCYDMESKNAISPRLKETIHWLKDPEVKEYFSNLTEDTQPITYFYDLRYSNKCNLACIGCNPYFSSLWAKELGISNPSAPSIDFELSELTHIKKVYFAGGEPLMIEQYLKIMDYIIEHDLSVEVVINTNLTVVSEHILDKLSKLKDCCLTVSIDSFGSANEYHRYPMSWNKFMNNLNAVTQRGLKVRFSTVADAVSVFGFNRLIELQDIPSQWEINLVGGVEALNLNNIPPHLKHQALECVETLKNLNFYKQDIQFKRQVDVIINEIKKDGDPEILINYIKTLDDRRQINHQTYLGINFLEKSNEQ